MENALLIVHLVLVIVLIAVVLLQRSEGGALGMGGGGGGVVSGRGATTALQKVTWYVAAGFIATSLALTIIATTKRQAASVFDQESAITSPSDVPVIAPDAFAPPTIGNDIGGTGSAGDAVPAPAPTNGGTATEPSNLVPAPAPAN